MRPTFQFLPPDSQTPVDSVGYRDWFYRLSQWARDVQAQVDAIVSDVGFTGNYIPLSVGTEPIEIVGDGAGQMILIWYEPNG